MAYRNLIDWNVYLGEETEIEALKGDAANRAFDRCEKESAYLFIQCTDEA